MALNDTLTKPIDAVRAWRDRIVENRRIHELQSFDRHWGLGQRFLRYLPGRLGFDMTRGAIPDITPEYNPLQDVRNLPKTGLRGILQESRGLDLINVQALMPMTGQELDDVFSKAKSDFVPASLLKEEDKEWFEEITNATEMNTRIDQLKTAYQTNAPNALTGSDLVAAGLPTASVKLQSLFEELGINKETTDSQGNIAITKYGQLQKVHLQQHAALDKLFDTSAMSEADAETRNALLAEKFAISAGPERNNQLVAKKTELQEGLRKNAENQINALKEVFKDKQSKLSKIEKDENFKKEIGLAALRAMLTPEQMHQLQTKPPMQEGQEAVFGPNQQIAANRVDPREAGAIKNPDNGITVVFNKDAATGNYTASSKLDGRLTGWRLEKKVDQTLDMMVAGGATTVSATVNRNLKTEKGMELAKQDLKIFCTKAYQRGLNVSLSAEMKNIYNPDTDPAMKKILALKEQQDITRAGKTPAVNNAKQDERAQLQAEQFKQQFKSAVEEPSRAAASTPTR